MSLDSNGTDVNNAVDPTPDTYVNYSRLILHRLFEEIEQHIIEEHIPRTVSNAFMPETSTVNYYPFRGITHHADPATLSFMLSCSCGRGWSISLSQLQHSINDVDPQAILDDFCRRVADRYATETANYMGSFPIRQEIVVLPADSEGDRINERYLSMKNQKTKKTKTHKKTKIKKKKEDKVIVFNNAIEGLEI